MALTTTQRTDLIKVYLAAFNRAPDASGLDFWARSIDNGTHSTVTAVADAWFNDSTLTEVVAAYPSFLTNEEFVGRIYTNVFGRAADAEGLAFWSASLANGANTKGSLLVNMFASLNNAGSEADLAVFNNKVAVSENFALVVGSNDVALAASILVNVDGTAASVTAANATANATANAGSTFTLTTGVDTLTGTASNDTFVADNTGTDVTSTADAINGGAGTDTINIFSDGAAAALPALTSVEVANIYDQDATIDLSATAQSSLTEVNFLRGDGAVLTLGANVATVGLTDLTLASVGGGTDDTVVAFGAARTEATLNLSAVTAAGGAADENIDINGAALTTVNINVLTDSDADVLDVAGATTINLAATGDLTLASGITTTGTATLNVSGAGDVDLSDLDADIDTITSTGTGSLTAEIGANVDTVLTAGSGNDVITASTTDAIASTDELAVNGGDGTDVLVVAATADINTTADGARYTNFETIRTADSLDMSLVSGITALQITGGTSETYSNMSATQLANITFRADNTTATTFTGADVSGSADVATINLSSTTSTTNIDLAGIGVDNIETVNFNVTTGTNTTGDSAITFGANLADEVAAINFTGTGDTTLTVAANTLDVIAVNIDASAMTGTADFTLVQTSDLVKGSTVTGTDNADTIALGTTTGSTYNGRGGNDAFSTVIATLVATGSDDTVVNGGDGTDTLTITDNGSTATDNHFTYVTGMEKLTYSDGGSVSLTAGGAFNTAFADGVTITAAGMDDAATFTYAGGLYDKATTIALTTAAVGNSGGEDITLTTGDAADTVTVTAASYVGATGDSGSFVINTAGGDDTISLTTGTLKAIATSEAITITAGTGADDITVSTTTKTTVQSAANFVIGAGDSLTTAYDQITGFLDADGTNLSMTLDFAGVGAVSDFTNSVDYGTILSHNNSNGVITFDDAAAFSAAIVIDSSNLSDVLGYLAANTDTNDVAAFLWDSDDSGSADAMMVYHNGTTDSLVELVGVTTTVALTATLTTSTNHYMAIA